MTKVGEMRQKREISAWVAGLCLAVAGQIILSANLMAQDAVTGLHQEGAKIAGEAQAGQDKALPVSVQEEAMQPVVMHLPDTGDYEKVNPVPPSEETKASAAEAEEPGFFDNMKAGMNAFFGSKLATVTLIGAIIGGLFGATAPVWLVQATAAVSGLASVLAGAAVGAGIGLILGILVMKIIELKS